MYGFMPLAKVSPTQLEDVSPSTTCPPSSSPGEEEAPKVLDSRTLDRAEIKKIQRIVTPKPITGKLEVPQKIFDMWQDVGRGRDTVLKMWAKSGGVKDCFRLRMLANPAS